MVYVWFIYSYGKLDLKLILMSFHGLSNKIIGSFNLKSYTRFFVLIKIIQRLAYLLKIDMMLDIRYNHILYK